jgi:hypothetical protein
MELEEGRGRDMTIGRTNKNYGIKEGKSYSTKCG